MISGSPHRSETSTSATPLPPHVARNPQPDWGLLQTFLSVIDAGSYRQAAKSLSLNTVRKRIATLERHTGLKLVECSVNGVAATKAGERLLAQARLMRDTLERHLSDDKETD